MSKPREGANTMATLDLIGPSPTFQAGARQRRDGCACGLGRPDSGRNRNWQEVDCTRDSRGRPSAQEPFCALNCAGIPATLLESELFPYERGAFIGATAAKSGICKPLIVACSFSMRSVNCRFSSSPNSCASPKSGNSSASVVHRPRELMAHRGRDAPKPRK